MKTIGLKDALFIKVVELAFDAVFVLMRSVVVGMILIGVSIDGGSVMEL